MRSIIRIAVLSMILTSIPALAQEIGRVHFVSGVTDVVRGGQKFAVQAGSTVRQGDAIVTGEDGHAQLVMVDGARIAVRPKSQLRLDVYEFDRAGPGAGRALLWLVTGTMRVFTGGIVDRDRNRFSMRTNLANIGIRGSGNILANLEGGVTFNHTLSGVHSVTSLDALGIERTTLSYPGQTVQVLPGQPPRHVPTPALIMAAASPPAAAKASEKPVETAQSSAAGGAASSTAASSTTASSSSSSEPASSGSTTSSGTSTASPDTGTTTAASTGTTTTSTTTTTTTPTTSTSPTTTTSPSSITGPTAGVGNPTVTAPQAATGTVGSSIGTAQGTAAGGDIVFRFFAPIASGFEGAVGENAVSGTGAIFDSGGRLIQVRDAAVSTFLAGPGSLPAGYDTTTVTGDVAFNGGTHRDGFRASDSSIVLGRWEGGNVSLGGRTFELGPRSVSYEVVAPTASGIVGSFTGAATYSLAAATAPSDSAGRTGSVGSATVSANFSARTVTGSFALALNGQNFSLSGNTGLDPGSSGFSFASSLQTLGIACSGSCSTLGYLGTMNGTFAGSSGRWLSVSYRLNPVRQPGSGFADFIVGGMALESATAPTVGIVLPQTGTANLAFNGVDAAQSFSTYPTATGTPAVSGTLQANFTAQTVSFNATLSGAGSPTFAASSAAAPIVGAGFSASTDAQRPPSVGAMTVTCAGTGCGASPAGRFDGLFRTSAGTAGIASIIAGDSAGAYQVTASFGPAALAAQQLGLARSSPLGIGRGRYRF